VRQAARGRAIATGEWRSDGVAQRQLLAVSNTDKANI
jgi:hypothetical protein